MVGVRVSELEKEVFDILRRQCGVIFLASSTPPRLFSYEQDIVTIN